MFRKSFIMVVSVLALVFGSAFATQMWIAGQLPSAFDPGIKIEEAFSTSEHPLLIEFYSDTCSACRQVTPVVHRVYQEHFKDRLTLVMLDIEDPDVMQVSQLFGVQAIPAVYVFDAKNMKKEDIALEALFSETRLRDSLKTALAETNQRGQKTAAMAPSKTAK